MIGEGTLLPDLRVDVASDFFILKDLMGEFGMETRSDLAMLLQGLPKEQTNACITRQVKGNQYC